MAAASAARHDDTLYVRGQLDFAAVARLWQATQGFFQGATPVRRIDLSAVQHSNSAGVALLVAWLHQAQNRHWALTFVNVPKQMHAIISAAALDSVLPLESPPATDSH